MTITLPTDGFGVYEGVNTLSNSSVYQPRLAQIAAGGFKLVMNYSLLHGHIADVIAYINYAASVGLKVIVYLADPRIWRDNTYASGYSQLYADSGNASTGIAFMQYIVGQVSGLAGVWGWYVGDEVLATDHTTFKTYTDAVHTADSTHPRLVIQGASDATNSFGASTTTMWDCCDVGGDDDYPVGTTNALTIASLSIQAAGVQSYCTAKGLSSAFAIQAHSLSPYGTIGAPWPTVQQMIQMRNNVLSSMTARVVLWYSYFDVVITGSPNFAPTNQWYFLENATNGRTGIVTFPALVRRGSPDQNNYYTQAIVADTPIAYYRLNEGSGLVAFDQTSNHYNGTIGSSGVSYLQGGAINQDTNTSMKFSNGHITFPANVNGSGLSAFSIELWVNPSSLNLSLGSFANILMGDTSASLHSYQLYLFNSSGSIHMTFGASNGTTSQTATDVNTTYTTNTWYQVVGSFDGSFIYLFVNGSVRAKSALTGTLGTTSSTPTLAASTSFTSPFSGWIDEVSFYSYNLGTKVPTHYAAALRAPSTATLFPPLLRRGS